MIPNEELKLLIVPFYNQFSNWCNLLLYCHLLGSVCNCPIFFMYICLEKVSEML